MSDNENNLKIVHSINKFQEKNVETVTKYKVIWEDNQEEIFDADIIDPEYAPMIIFAKREKDGDDFNMVSCVNMNKIYSITRVEE